MGALNATKLIVDQAAERTGELQRLAASTLERLDSLAKYRDAYRHYCWPVASIDDLKVSPFHLLASEGAVHTNKPHTWHMETLAKLSADDLALLLAILQK